MARLLIVEDDHHGQVVTRRLLEHQQIEVDMADDALQALDYFQHQHYSAVLIDLSLPGMSGWDLLKEIRIQQPDIPCIAITSYHSPEVAQRCIEVGFNAYFTKPINVYSFVDDIRRHMALN